MAAEPNRDERPLMFISLSRLGIFCVCVKTMCDSWYQLIPRAAGKRYWNIIVMTCMCVLNSFRETKWRIVWRSERLEKHTKKMNRFLPFDGKSQRPHSLSLAWQPRAFKVDFIDMKWNGARRWRHRAAINRFQGRKKGKKKKEWLAWEWVEDGNKMAVNKWASA